MRLISHLQSGEARLAAVTENDQVVDLNRAYAAAERAAGSARAASIADARVPADILAFLGLGERAIEDARAALAHVAGLDETARVRDLLVMPLGEVRLLPAVPKPPKIVCVARNYADHAKEAGRSVSEIPILFARFPATLVASGEPVIRPSVSEQLDWEGELAVVIGRAGHRISKASALEHVAGYSIFNDVTVRDFQFRVTQYTAGKNFRASGPFGPELRLREDGLDPSEMEIVTDVSGEVMQRGNTRDMLFDVPTIIEHVSEFIGLEPGDVIAMGTPAGVGFSRTPPRFLRPGETVAVSITGLGRLENPIVAEEDVK
jgi:2-keto-4-pentenoate hydratase/2-oxohepta-3-ene-1,7-dioic acid hydratase in catechol pathway